MGLNGCCYRAGGPVANFKCSEIQPSIIFNIQKSKMVRELTYLNHFCYSILNSIEVKKVSS